MTKMKGLYIVKSCFPIFCYFQSLYLASALLKFIWTNAALGTIPPATLAANVGQHKNQRRLRQGNGQGNAKFIAEISSSENSVSVDASHSDDEIQVPLKH